MRRTESLKYFFCLYNEQDLPCAIFENYKEIQDYFPEYTYGTLRLLISKERPLYLGGKSYKIYKINKGEE